MVEIFEKKLFHENSNIFFTFLPYFILGLDSLPLAPAAPFHSQPPKANLYDQFVYTPSQCSHGPNLAGGASFGQIPQFQHLQTVSAQYGVPAQPLDVSQSSSFEIAQNAKDLLTSYGPPASGAVTNSDSFIGSHDGSSNLQSSYGPPPSGNPSDSFAHGSQKSLSTVQIDSLSNSSTNNSETKVDELPGLSSSGLNIISAQKSVDIEIPVQGQLGSYSLQFQSADPLASQNNEIDSPNHQKLLSEGLLQSILSAIEQPKSNDAQQSVQIQTEHLDNHPAVNEFVNSAVGQETLGEVKAE